MATLSVLHNLGAFDFRSVPLLVYGVWLLLAVGATLFVVARAVLWTWSRRRPSRGGWMTLVLALIVGVVAVHESRGKFALARGWEAWERGDIATAGECLERAARWERNPALALRTLTTVCEHAAVEAALIDRALPLVARADQSDVVSRFARVLRRYDRNVEAARLLDQRADDGFGTSLRVEAAAAWWRAGDGTRAAAVLEHLAVGELSVAERGEYHRIQAQLAWDRGDTGLARAIAADAVAAEPDQAEYHSLLGRILIANGEPAAGERALQEALALRAELPEAHHALGLFHYQAGRVADATSHLERAVYYDNRDVVGAILLAACRAGQPMSFGAIQPLDRGARPPRAATPDLVMTAGETRPVTVVLGGFESGADVRVLCLEPYGFGVDAEVREARAAQDEGGSNGWKATLNVLARRPDRVNLDRPWRLNVVAWDARTGAYLERPLMISVRDPADREGRALFVITEDLEQTVGSVDRTGGIEIPQVRAEDVRRDLIAKPALAEELAGCAGVRWSHAVDVGSVLSRVDWAASACLGPDWHGLGVAVRQRLGQSVRAGHDLQLHIHGYNLPGNRLSRQRLDSASGIIRFEDDRPRVPDAAGFNGAWAENFRPAGDWKDPESRTGSLFAGIRLLEQLQWDAGHDRPVLFFRAGEYEFGRGRASVAASIQAMRRNGLLAGSDAHEGNPFRRDFRFHQPVGRNVYFTAQDTIDARAESLLDVGIAQFLPVPERHGHDHLSPVSQVRDVAANYARCLAQGRIKPGLFVLLEMYHLNGANARASGDPLDPARGHWVAMRTQFEALRARCPRLEPVTVAEAIKAWYDEQSPDLVPVRSGLRPAGAHALECDLTLLGRDITVDARHPHHVAVKPPSHLLGRIRRCEVRQGDQVVAAWDSVTDYRDLRFVVRSREGLRMWVSLTEASPS